MQNLWSRLLRTKARIRVVAILLSLSILIYAIWIFLRQRSLTHPGPAIMLAGLACVVLLVGWVVDRLAHMHTGLPVLGIEHLINRWQRFKTENEEHDTEVLYQQISIAMSITQLHYKHKVSFTKAFPGIKIERGTFLLKPGPNEPSLVLKFDSVTHIQEETKRYKDCIDQRLGLVPGAPRIPNQRYGTINDEPWGAITYNLIRDFGRLQNLSEFLTHNNFPTIQMALHRTFKTLKPLWTNQVYRDECAQTRHDTLYSEYDRLTRKYDEIEQGIHELGNALSLQSLMTITPVDSQVALNGLSHRNPLHWVIRQFKARQVANWINDQAIRRDSIVHGDFHGGNILISYDGWRTKVWLIDFPHTHVGPTVQDIARLEADIKFSLLSNDLLQTLGIGTIYAFETCLLPNYQPGVPPLAALTPQPFTEINLCRELDNLWNIVCLLRHKAQKYMNGNDARPYYLALLHATLPILYYRNREPWQKLYAFMSAALLSDRL